MADDTLPQAVQDWATVIVEAVDDALFCVDRTWRFVAVNRHAQAIWGRNRTDLLGTVMWEAFPSLLGSELEPFYREAMATQRPNRLDVRSPLMQAWYQVRVYPIPHGLVISFHDSTARKSLEQSLRASEARLQALSDAALEGIMVHDGETILDANKAAVQLCGYASLEELVGQPLVCVVDPASQPTMQQHIQAHFDGVYEFVMVRKDGSRFPAEGRATWVTYQGQRVRVGAFHDVTLRNQAMLQFAQLQKLESIGRFARGTAHGFNNLLSIILSATELTARELAPTHPVQHLLQHVLQATRQGARMIAQLLTFARQQPPNLHTVDLNDVVSTQEPLLQRVLGERSDLIVHLAPDLPRICADADHLEHSLLHLVANARDAMPEGGTLTITTAHCVLRQDDVRPSDLAAGSYVCIRFADTGIGMDAATQRYMFEPFFTTKDPGSGTGLGLATVYGMVQEHGGAIVCTSAVNRGTTFTIYLPQAAQM